MSIAAIKWAIAQPLPASAKVVLLALAERSDPEGNCWPSIDALASILGVHERTVRRATALLNAAGMIEREWRRAPGGRFGSNAYRLLMLADEGVKPAEKTDRRAQLTGGHFCPADTLTGGHLVSDGKDKEPPLPSAVASAQARKGLRLVSTREPEAEPSAHSPGQQPEAWVPDPVEGWGDRLRQAHARLGQRGSEAVGGLMHFADLRRLCQPAFGPGCDFELDVLPAIDKLAAEVRVSGNVVRSWSWIERDAVAMRNRRLAGLPAPDAVAARSGKLRESGAERADRIVNDLKKRGIL